MELEAITKSSGFMAQRMCISPIRIIGQVTEIEEMDKVFKIVVNTCGMTFNLFQSKNRDLRVAVDDIAMFDAHVRTAGEYNNVYLYADFCIVVRDSDGVGGSAPVSTTSTSYTPKTTKPRRNPEPPPSDEDDVPF